MLLPMALALGLLTGQEHAPTARGEVAFFGRVVKKLALLHLEWVPRSVILGDSGLESA